MGDYKMKKLLIMWAIFTFCLSTASALQISSSTLGSSNALQGTSVNSTLTITNNDNAILSNIGIMSSADSRYGVTFTNIPSSLGIGQSAVITVRGYIPSDYTGSNKIGTMTITASKNAVYNSNTNSPNTQSPQEIVVPVSMSASSDTGAGTSEPDLPIIGQWHVGSVDGVSDIFINNMNIDAGWARVHTNDITSYWVSPVELDCLNPVLTISSSNNIAKPPKGWTLGGKIHSGPGLCDGSLEVASGDSGWIGFYSNPLADGKLIVVIAEDDSGFAREPVPANGIVIGKVRVKNSEDSPYESAYSYSGRGLDSGIVEIVWVPVTHTVENSLPIGRFESVNSTMLKGWAYDADAPSISVNIHVDGVFWKFVNANLARPDLVESNKTPDANHGFEYAFTAADKAYLDFSKNHTFTAYAVNSPLGENPLLEGSLYLLASVVNNSTTNNTNNSTSNNTNTTNNTNNVVSASADLYMQVGANVVIDRVKVNCDKLKTVSEGSSVDASPGQTCYVTVRIKNEGSVDFPDVFVELEDADEIEGDSNYLEIDEGDSEETTLSFDIDEDADGKYQLVLNVEAEDDDNNVYTDTFSFYVKVDRPKHALEISRILVSPAYPKVCEDSNVFVTVYVENNGKDDEDRAAVELSIPNLNFNQKLDLSIDEDDSDSVKFTVPVNKAGSFTATAKVFYDRVVESDSDTATLTIEKCEEVVVQSQGGASKFVEPKVVVVPQSTVTVEPVQVEESFLSSAWFTGLLVVANLIAASLLGVMVYGFFKKPEEPGNYY